MDFDGIYIFKSDSGTTLYSRQAKDVQEDLFSAFLTALKGFFSDFALGGLSSFASDNYMIYLASASNVLTSIIVNNELKSDKYFKLAYEISFEFYEHYKEIIDKKVTFILPKKEEFDLILDKIVEDFDKKTEIQKEIIKLYNIDSNGDLEMFDFINEEQLFGLPLFIAVNFITKQILVIENADENVPSRKLFFASKQTSKMNQHEFKSQFQIVNVSDPWDFERIVEQISKLLAREK